MSAKVNDNVPPVRCHVCLLATLLILLSACANLNPGGASSPKLTLTFRDWAIDKDRDEIRAGPTTILLRNQSARTHEFVMIRINSKSQLPLHIETTNPNEPLDEDQFSEEQIVTEVEHLPPGQVLSHEVTLIPGEYLIFCNVMESTADGVVSHYGMGMRTELTVVK
ncbi:MAG: hypothetical protein GC138_08215 [Gammaproteobacteria bacterium]|nr:hypothetical protein [Gammaproteobacteria bacterium]